jgi:hypothetical protein
MSQENVDIVGRKLASPHRPSATRTRMSATAVPRSLSASISQERRYALTRDAELLGDFLHGHPLLVQRERLCSSDTGAELIERLRCLGDQLNAEIALRRFDYLPIRLPGGPLTPDLSNPALYLGHTPSVGIQRAL